MGKFKLFLMMAKVGVIGFGGGNALIPIIQKEVVEDKKLISEEEYEEDVLIASITPGALPVEIAGGVGSRVAGWKGAFCGSVGMALPGVLLAILFMSFISNVNSSFTRQINYMMIGITAYIALLLTDYVMKTVKKAKGGYKAIYLCIIILVFALTCGKKIYNLFGLQGEPIIVLSTIQIFKAGIGGIIIASFFVKKKQTDTFFKADFKSELVSTGKELMCYVAFAVIFSAPAIAITFDAIKYLVCGLFSSVLSFGGGDAYLTVADGFFVGNKVVSDTVFYCQIVPFANLIPGSILIKVFSLVGYTVGYNVAGVPGGIFVAMAGMLCGILASCGIFVLIRFLYRRFGEFTFFVLIKSWIRPIVSGLMLTVIVSLLGQVKKIGVIEELEITSVLIFAFIYLLNLFMFYKRKWKNYFMAFISLIISLILCNILGL